MSTKTAKKPVAKSRLIRKSPAKSAADITRIGELEAKIRRLETRIAVMERNRLEDSSKRQETRTDYNGGLAPVSFTGIPAHDVYPVYAKY